MAARTHALISPKLSRVGLNSMVQSRHRHAEHLPDQMFATTLCKPLNTFLNSIIHWCHITTLVGYLHSWSVEDALLLIRYAANYLPHSVVCFSHIMICLIQLLISLGSLEWSSCVKWDIAMLSGKGSEDSRLVTLLSRSPWWHVMLFVTWQTSLCSSDTSSGSPCWPIITLPVS